MSCGVLTVSPISANPNSATDDPGVDHPGGADDAETASIERRGAVEVLDQARELSDGDEPLEEVGARSEHNERWLMTPIGAMSQLTPCIHKGLARGSAPSTPGHRYGAAPRRFVGHTSAVEGASSSRPCAARRRCTTRLLPERFVTGASPHRNIVPPPHRRRRANRSRPPERSRPAACRNSASARFDAIQSRPEWCAGLRSRMHSGIVLGRRKHCGQKAKGRRGAVAAHGG